ncbi:uncharacterized protein [Rutidosis leptorrhynchoides]|uniref:uncharacterized protein isoform X2 n=1 Tax=Rutidosis leptorrhynchoides TaxID=125765 RepID=UPI003A9A0788
MPLPIEYAHFQIPLKKIVKATNNFADENLIGQGGFGKVYQGKLYWFGEMMYIAARRLHYEYGQGDTEFWTEIFMLDSLKHENLVSIIGFCHEDDEKIIVNKLEAHKSLDRYLSGPDLTWMQRLEICVGVAHALRYMIHYDVTHHFSVIHRNIKSSKILLDENWKPKLSGFEISMKNNRAGRNRLLLAEINGTIGYVDPTYKRTGFVTHKSDIYSFGVVLFEVLCGRRAFILDEQELGGSPHRSANQVFYNDGKPDHMIATSAASDPSTSTELQASSDIVPDFGPVSFVSERFGRQQHSSFNSVGGSSFNYRHKSLGTNKDSLLPTETSPSKIVKSFMLNPLFTMKRLEQYKRSLKEDLLAPLAKSHYEEGTLEKIIHPDLRKYMDSQSFHIVSETAYSCLKLPGQRPHIDQIVINLEKALKVQRKLENSEHSKFDDEAEGTPWNHLKGKNLEHLKIPLIDIELATNKFDESYLIGSGTYGKVYKAQLEMLIDENNNKGEVSKKIKTVAIKRILMRDDKHGEEGFIAEIDLLTRCNHPNVVSLLGFCIEGSHMVLVYEHACNGSVDDYLGRTDKLINLTWVQRIKICIDVARGLDYLHTRLDDERRIIHRDIKSGNILLGKNMEAKIADFGLSRLVPPASRQENTLYTNNIAGTNVYLDPEYENTGKLKKEIDIYSFGVVLFEIMSGKYANDPIYMAEDDKGLVSVARRCFEERKIHEIADPKIMEEVDELTSTLNKGPNQDSLNTFSKTAYQCVAQAQIDRPTAKFVIEELEKALHFQENHRDSLKISLEDIKMATQNFSQKNLIGGGGFGRVYKGEVIHANGRKNIAAKRLDKSQGQGQQEFLTELEILFEYKHENIIGLVGYCNEMNEKIIVYELASNRSLDGHLKDISLTWMKRLKICIDVAYGLDFLHRGTLTKEMVIHRDIKCGNILLNGDWKAKISDFGLSFIGPVNQEKGYEMRDLVGTIGYVDPQYERMGYLTKESDIYSFGVVLFEILYGKLLVPSTRNYEREDLMMVLRHIYDKRSISLIVFEGIKKQIAPESLSTFRKIVRQCLYENREKRPSAKEVLLGLNKALEFQEDYEIWEPKLPKDYKQIILMSKSFDIYSTAKKKDLYNLFSKGILLHEDKVCFTFGCNGERNEMISARNFSYKNCSPHEWRSVADSRFPEVVEMLDISNLVIKVKTQTRLLSPDVVYGFYLIFKFCDVRKFSSKPVYVNLKFTNGSEPLHAYFATWRDKDWMMIELCRFLNNKEGNVFKFILDSFSPYYGGEGAVYIEGIEFRAVHNLPQVPSNTPFRRHHSDAVIQSASWMLKKLLTTQSLYSSEVNEQKHLMISPKAALYDCSNKTLFISKPSARSRFQEVLMLLPQQVFRVNCTVESQMLSPDTEYVCYLAFKLSKKCHGMHYPLKVRDLQHGNNDEAEIIYLTAPSPWNCHDTIQLPEQREDGWMEVKVWKFNSKHHLKNDHIIVNLKFTSYEETMSGLVVCGLEFRPI